VARVLRMPEVADDSTAATLTAWLVHESADFGGTQSLATVETASSLLSIEVSEPGVLIKSLVEPGQEVHAGSPLAVLGAPGEVIEDVEQLMVQLGLAVAPEGHQPDVHLRAVPHDELRATAWPPHEPTQLALTPLVEAVPERGPDPGPEGLSDAGSERVGESDLVAPPRIGSRAKHATERHAEPVVEDHAREAAQDLTADAVALPVASPATRRAPQATSVVRQVHLREEIRADALIGIVRTVEAVSLIGLVVKAVATTTRRVPLLSGVSSVTDVAVQRWTEMGTIAPVVHVAGLMTVSSLTSTLRGLEARARDGRVASGDLQPATVTVVDLGTFRAGEAALDATVDHPAVLTLGGVREQAVVEDGAIVPGQTMVVTLSCNADSVEASTAALWLAHLVKVLEQPLHFLT
jgi:pyruvate dehydrogenase E2 component (dihydrolipoamide acetyltransferase)